ncbi:DUF2207 domain-containing protein [Bifidobacterium sp. ESL0784]|uniref:DUF2207 domain-containing protein n=1 Tax=Bifidobacterium sp. ESL0784 TaxID=2983231 RepID=UPI0023F96991|nr:DUF2207 domain-containing protein [Bifidobacterium sp. ESL0784]
MKSDGVLSAITDVSVTNVSTGQKYRHGSAGSSRDLDNFNWDGKYAGQWYAADFANAYNREGDEYLPAAMDDGQYRQKTAGSDDKTAGSSAHGPAAPNDKTAAPGNKTDSKPDDLRDENGVSASMGKSGDTVEIGWNIPATQSAKSLKFDISMTFKDVVKVYNDVAYSKWEPISDTGGVPIGDFHAKVTLPKGVKSTDVRQDALHRQGFGQPDRKPAD